MNMSGALNLWAFFLRQGHLNLPIIIGPPIYKVNKNLRIGKEKREKSCTFAGEKMNRVLGKPL